MPITEDFVKHLMEQNATMGEQILHLTKTDEILKNAYVENPLHETTDEKCGRKKGEILNLIGCLNNYKVSVCLFIKNFCVPSYNIQAVRDTRIIKLKIRITVLPLYGKCTGILYNNIIYRNCPYAWNESLRSNPKRTIR